MQDLLVMAMFDCESDLSEPIQELVFSHVILTALPVDSLEPLLDFLLQVTIVCVVHHNAELALLGLVNFAETSDIGMVENL